MGMGRGGFGGGGFRGGFQGGMGMGRGGFGGRGGFQGHGVGAPGAPGGPGGGRDFSNDLYADYNGNGGMAVEQAEPNQQIFVKNVSPPSLIIRLPLTDPPAPMVYLE